MIVGRANKNSWGEYGITIEQYREEIQKAKKWFKEHPNPPESAESE